jgi:hypothetical protein
VRQRYVTKFGNWNGWWDNLQLVEQVTVCSQREAVEYVAFHNGGHDLYYQVSASPMEGYLQEILDDRLTIISAGPLATDDLFEITFDNIDWDLIIYWPGEDPPVRVDFTFDPEAPSLDLRTALEEQRWWGETE